MFNFYLSSLILLFVYLSIEYLRLQRALNTIKIRILVNGTRGKSTMVRLLCEIFRAQGYRCYGKSTGNSPVLMMPDGSQHTLTRMGPASIIENVKILIRAAKQCPDIFIMECMAIQPEMQSVLSHKIFKPTVTLIGNIFIDHEEVMGSTLDELCHTLAKCIYPPSHLLIPPDVAECLGNRHLLPPDFTVCPALSYKKEIFPIPEQHINNSWTLFSQAADHFGLNRSSLEEIFTHIWKESTAHIDIPLEKIHSHFYNLFSVNDIDSTSRFLTHIGADESSIFILNCRGDRPLRSVRFHRFLSKFYPGASLFLIGDSRSTRTFHLRNNHNLRIEGRILNSEDITEAFLEKNLANCKIFGLGNHRGSRKCIDRIIQKHNRLIQRNGL